MGRFIGATGMLETSLRITQPRWRWRAMSSYTQLPLIAPLKRCSKCDEPKPLSDFARKTGNRLQSRCRVCVAAIEREYRESHAEMLKQRRLKRYAEQRVAILARATAYRERNRDAVNLRKRESHATNAASENARRAERRQARIEDEREACRRWAREHRAEKRAYASAYNAANPDKTIARRHRRYAARMGKRDSFTAEQWRELLSAYDYRCLRCGRQEPEIKLTPDHVVPLSKGGGTDISNIQPLCGSCNSSKRARTIDYRAVTICEVRGGA
jgi:5-methylcytosine-specific restriction endonuclease McrA